MVEGDSGSPTWKFTQYVISPRISSLNFRVNLCQSINALYLRSIVFVDKDVRHGILTA